MLRYTGCSLSLHMRRKELPQSKRFVQCFGSNNSLPRGREQHARAPYCHAKQNRYSNIYVIKMKNDVPFYLAFIEEVEKHPALYDRNLPAYVNRRETDAIWSKIAEKFDMQLHTVKGKWKVIRSSYVRSLTSSEKTGAKEYYLSKYLHFLKEFVQFRGPNRSRLVNESDEEDTTDLQNDEYLQVQTASDDEFNDMKPIEEVLFDPMPPQSSQSSSSKITKKKRQHFDDDGDEDERPMENNKRVRSNDVELNEEPCRMFMLSLVPYMKTMNPQQQLSFQKRVLDVIEDIKFGQP